VTHLGGSIDVLHKKQHGNLSCLVPAACFVLFVSATAPVATADLNIPPQCSAEVVPNVTIEHSTLDNATIYSTSSGGCSITLTARDSEKGVIKQCSQCASPLALQLPLLTKIYEEFFSSDENAQVFRTLFWGRLEPDTQNGSREMSLRLALAAYKSPGWDVKRGKPKSGDINGFVKDLANRAMIYPELKELFERFDRIITFSCAEKVLVTEAAKLPFCDQLKQRGIKATDKLPFDCMTWFAVSEK